ncbi:hypothetical protein MCERE10_02061 [Burkholderiaceae bacterium]
MISVNEGYQAVDAAFIDYELWSPPGLGCKLRGPQFDINSNDYFSVVGAAQTFGRFCQKPYPMIISEKIGLKCLNIGMSGAGPSFFSKSEGAIELINKSKFCIVQVLSGRSIANSIFELGKNHGQVKNKEDNTDFEFSEFAYSKLLKYKNKFYLEALRSENRYNYVLEMIELLSLINVPKIFFYFSDRDLDYKEDISNIGNYWGSFPHFINSDVIKILKKYVDEYIESTIRVGLPQAIFDNAGMPCLIWDEKVFPSVKFRYHNNYYPSPEMHAAASSSLINVLSKYI